MVLPEQPQQPLQPSNGTKRVRKTRGGESTTYFSLLSLSSQKILSWMDLGRYMMILPQIESQLVMLDPFTPSPHVSYFILNLNSKILNSLPSRFRHPVIHLVRIRRHSDLNCGFSVRKEQFSKISIMWQSFSKVPFPALSPDLLCRNHQVWRLTTCMFIKFPG